MFTTTRPRRLIIPLDDGELTLVVEGDTAVLELAAPRRPAAEPLEPDEGVDDGADEPAEVRVPLRLRVPARALVAALRVGWADEHDLRCFEPWRDVTREGRWNGYRETDRYAYGYPGDRYAYGYPDDDRRWYDDLGDGDPGGYRDPTVVPFPRPAPPPRPSRAYQPWEQDEEEKLREMWLAADPGTDREVLVRQIAEGLERGVGGIGSRLAVVGCDPARPGRRRFEPDDEASAGGAVDLDAAAEAEHAAAEHAAAEHAADEGESSSGGSW